MALSLVQTLRPPTVPTFVRALSTSPYGRTHVWKKRAPKLPKPFVPHFPQRVVLADGSSFIHHTTSPRGTFRSTRDTTNNPLWNSLVAREGEEEEGKLVGRMGRFSKKFEGMEISDIEVEGSSSKE
ncbi:uncharacterized protein PHACADRAFT_261604 [Phanerochaete carnosa HHB-10118-sp]|uniref:Ribosomal protein bL31m N-terminal domain-containing protein n=1 Tax=Phanerochaete carnosa (strain HHB-10118-sp) TaxID=650164 RepID=K5USL8_PHACS|nr:uncharacterized protein PHACADRAFT_261604 [Phanerochaete carnosa HHB-10118-sp]EKM52911.1 hypothetical protein PHACADRAFT_261604 [Phanerochaete carnosa HHB-10118-sp]